GGSKWTVRDGFFEFHPAVGAAGGPRTNRLFQWLHEHGECDDAIAAIDWARAPEQLEDGSLKESDIELARECLGRFMAKHDKAELFELMMTLGVYAAPVFTTVDIADSQHYLDRSFWRPRPDGADRHRLPGHFGIVTKPVYEFRRAAPG